MALQRILSSSVITNRFFELARPFSTGKPLANRDIIDPPGNEPPIPQYEWKKSESIEQQKARLLYQSRKRGMLENGLLLSTFATKHLEKFPPDLLNEYDHLINDPSNDWDIFNWAAGIKPTPPEFDTTVMNMLKEHVQNNDREARIKQPDLY